MPPPVVLCRCSCGTSAACSLHFAQPETTGGPALVLYRDLAAEEQKLAEEGMADYAAILLREDAR